MRKVVLVAAFWAGVSVLGYILGMLAANLAWGAVAPTTTTLKTDELKCDDVIKSEDEANKRDGYGEANLVPTKEGVLFLWVSKDGGTARGLGFVPRDRTIQGDLYKKGGDCADLKGQPFSYWYAEVKDEVN